MNKLKNDFPEFWLENKNKLLVATISLSLTTGLRGVACLSRLLDNKLDKYITEESGPYTFLELVILNIVPVCF
jgi:hypothetical protein